MEPEFFLPTDAPLCEVGVSFAGQVLLPGAAPLLRSADRWTEQQGYLFLSYGGNTNDGMEVHRGCIIFLCFCICGKGILLFTPGSMSCTSRGDVL